MVLVGHGPGLPADVPLSLHVRDSRFFVVDASEAILLAHHSITHQQSRYHDQAYDAEGRDPQRFDSNDPFAYKVDLSA